MLTVKLTWNGQAPRLKRFLAREIYQRVMTDFRARQTLTQAA